MLTGANGFSLSASGCRCTVCVCICVKTCGAGMASCALAGLLMPPTWVNVPAVSMKDWDSGACTPGGTTAVIPSFLPGHGQLDSELCTWSREGGRSPPSSSESRSAAFTKVAEPSSSFARCKRGCHGFSPLSPTEAKAGAAS